MKRPLIVNCTRCGNWFVLAYPDYDDKECGECRVESRIAKRKLMGYDDDKPMPMRHEPETAKTA